MLLSGDAREGVENVCVVGGALGDGPVLHRGSDEVGDFRIELLAGLDGLAQLLVDVLGQPFLELFVIEHIAAKEFMRGVVLKVERSALGLEVGDSVDRILTGVVGLHETGLPFELFSIQVWNLWANPAQTQLKLQ